MTLQESLRARGARRPDVAPRRRRHDLVAFVAVLLGPTLFIGAAAAWRQRVGDLEERLVRDAWATVDAPRKRAVHADRAEPGSLGDALTKHLPAVEAVARSTSGEAGKADRNWLRAVVSGEASLAALPPRFASGLERLRPHLDAVLAGTRAERADPGEGAEAFMPAKGATWDGYHLAALLAGVESRRALAAGDARRAAALCLDALGLGRDAALTGGLVGRMIQVAIAGELAPACAAALAELAPDEARAEIGRLGAIREALPRFSATLDVEYVGVQLMVYGSLLPDRLRARLGPRARAISTGGELLQSRWERLLARDAWRPTRRAMDALVAVADLEPDARDSAEKRILEGLRGQLNPMPLIALPACDKYARRAVVGRRWLDAIALAAGAAAWRAERRAWPADPSVLAWAGLPTSGEAAARLEVVAGGRALEISLPVPQADPAKDPPRIRLRVAARRSAAGDWRAGPPGR